MLGELRCLTMTSADPKRESRRGGVLGGLKLERTERIELCSRRLGRPRTRRELDRVSVEPPEGIEPSNRCLQGSPCTD
jgi:hypothetical protein